MDALPPPAVSKFPKLSGFKLPSREWEGAQGSATFKFPSAALSPLPLSAPHQLPRCCAVSVVPGERPVPRRSHCRSWGAACRPRRSHCRSWGAACRPRRSHCRSWGAACRPRRSVPGERPVGRGAALSFLGSGLSRGAVTVVPGECRPRRSHCRSWGAACRPRRSHCRSWGAACRPRRSHCRSWGAACRPRRSHCRSWGAACRPRRSHCRSWGAACRPRRSHCRSCLCSFLDSRLSLAG